MVTRGIVQEIITPYKYRVRMPIFDGVSESPYKVSDSNLCSAVVSIPKGMHDSYKVGDVVFIAFEDNSWSKPVIIGHLYRKALNDDESTSLVRCRSVTVTESANLPADVTIGNITYSELLNLV